MSWKLRTYVRFLLIFGVLGVAGIAAAIYVVIHERFTLPFDNVYTINAQFSAADGVNGGTGQPVQVAGVKVGEITSVSLRAGVAVVSMQLQRNRIPHLYTNATAALEPVTPLNDMSIVLDPGSPPASALPAGATISVAQTSSPVPLSDLESRLDGDTRAYLASLITSLGQGTGNRGPDLRQMFAALGPTATQVSQITSALAARRTNLAQFVHNLAALSRAASRDGELSSVVSAGERTLNAVARQDAPLQQALRELPATLDTTRDTLSKLTPFATELGPTLRSLLPSVERLPSDLTATGRFSTLGTRVVGGQIRPLVRQAQPLLRAAAPGVVNLSTAAVPLTGVAQTVNYLLNELAYNPGGKDQGFLYWLDWGFHNLDSSSSTGDATGSVLRGTALIDCAGIQADNVLAKALPVLAICPH